MYDVVLTNKLHLKEDDPCDIIRSKEFSPNFNFNSGWKGTSLTLLSGADQAPDDDFPVHSLYVLAHFLTFLYSLYWLIF